MKKTIYASLTSLALAGMIMLTAGCSEDTTTTSKAGTFAGETKALGSGTVKSWVKWDDNGNPTSVGLTFSETALQNLTDTGAVEYSLMMPSQASATGIDHIGLDWNPQGHEPNPIYGLPHFDIHFYYLTMSERMTIAFGKDMDIPASKYVPANYITADSMSIPMMGVHWVDVTSGEFNGKIFDKTFIYGFSKGKLAFLEPMITKAFFETKPSVTVNIPQPSEWQTTNRYYPATYSVKYDATAKEYTVTLDGFVKK